MPTCHMTLVEQLVFHVSVFTQGQHCLTFQAHWTTPVYVSSYCYTFERAAGLSFMKQLLSVKCLPQFL